jgi:flagellar biosynthesis/type III secretory pathway M-ring protein FliF/YscJ
MENEIIMNGEEAMENAIDDIATNGSNRALMAVAGVGIAGLAVWATYKFVVKPLVAKAKAKKEQEVVDEVECSGLEVDEVEVEELD